ncbi:MAG: recombinase family protein, partial [Firmicutes bacterium]|nr:recombinase family protein [Bacillota bacterium]
DEVLAELTDTTALDAEAAALAQEVEVVAELTRKAVEENARAALDQDDYNARRNALLDRHAAATARQAEVEAARQQRRMKQVNITRFLQTLSQQENLVTEFDEELWYLAVDRVEVFEGGRLRVVFRDGATVDVPGEK